MSPRNTISAVIVTVAACSLAAMGLARPGVLRPAEASGEAFHVDHDVLPDPTPPPVAGVMSDGPRPCTDALPPHGKVTESPRQDLADEFRWRINSLAQLMCDVLESKMDHSLASSCLRRLGRAIEATCGEDGSEESCMLVAREVPTCLQPSMSAQPAMDSLQGADAEFRQWVGTIALEPVQVRAREGLAFLEATFQLETQWVSDTMENAISELERGCDAGDTSAFLSCAVTGLRSAIDQLWPATMSTATTNVREAARLIVEKSEVDTFHSPRVATGP